MEIPAAIRIAKQQKKPVYLVVAIDLVTKPIALHESQKMEQPKTNKHSLQEAVSAVELMLEQAQSAVMLVDMKTLRYGLQDSIQYLAEQMNIPVASLMQGKSGFDESHPQYIGMYGGAFGSEEVRDIVEGADCLIMVGHIQSDVNMSKYTAKLNPLKTIDIQPESVQVGEAHYSNIMAEDILSVLPTIGYRQKQEFTKPSFPYDLASGDPDEPIAASFYYPRIQQMLKEKDIVVVETGTLAYGMAQMKLPKGATYIAQGGWQSIGYATPAAFGACIAAKNQRVLLFTGDGSLQLTVQEISSMLENGCTPIIFVLNNKGYTIEKYLNVKTENQQYNQIPNWKYTKLVEVFGHEAFTMEVRTNGELDQAIKEAQNANKLCIIEMIAAETMDAPAYLDNMHTYLEKQEQQN